MMSLAKNSRVIPWGKMINTSDPRSLTNKEMYIALFEIPQKSWLPEFIQEVNTRVVQGDVTAQNNLGVMYRDGLGIAKDPKKAAE